MLYVCPTPIGNLKDITIRVLDILRSVDLILAEDTRSARKILTFYEIHNKKIIAYHKFSEKKNLSFIIEKLKNSVDIALISEAGTPCISDPGYLLLKECIKQNISFTVLPGASALITAILLSGFDPSQFTFVGFLPRKPKRRKELFEQLSALRHPIIFYISPHRLVEELTSIKGAFGDINASLSREITKQFEETIRGKISDIILQLKDKEIKGEYVLTIETGSNSNKKDTEYITVLSLIKKAMENKLREKDIAKELSKIYNKRANEVYEALKREE